MLTLEKDQVFALRHPELEHWIRELQGTYMTCQKHLPNDMEEVFEHVFKDPTTVEGHTYEGCPWCQLNFKLTKDYREQMLS